MPPIVGLTCSLDDKDARVRTTYISAVVRAGGVPILLSPPIGLSDDSAYLAAVESQLELCDALVLTGGPDLRTERYGVPTHPAAKTVNPDRQRFEEALIAALDDRRMMPTLGVCMGMQLMALHAGGVLNQHLPDDTPTHADHADDRTHAIIPLRGAPFPKGSAASHHHQAVKSPGRLRVVARAHDGVIEAIDDPTRPFYLGVQWHPERTSENALGLDLFRALIAQA